jgi:hypothetical protein
MVPSRWTSTLLNGQEVIPWEKNKPCHTGSPRSMAIPRLRVITGSAVSMHSFRISEQSMNKMKKKSNQVAVGALSGK